VGVCASAIEGSKNAAPRATELTILDTVDITKNVDK
jgi:hypothetical protein